MIIKMIGDWEQDLFDQALKEESTVKGACKAFIAGAIDSWNSYCLVLGNMIMLIGIVVSIMRKFKNPKEIEET